MSYKGHIERGQIVLDDSVELPEGTIVAVEVVEDASVEADLHPDVVRFTGIIPEGVDARRAYRDFMESKHQ